MRVVNSMGISPRLHFFCYEVSSLARSKALREAITVNITFLKCTDDDVAEYFTQKTGRPPGLSRTRSYSSSINCSPCLIEQKGSSLITQPAGGLQEGVISEVQYISAILTLGTQWWQEPDC